MPTRLLVTGYARPLFQTEGLGSSAAEQAILGYGLDPNDCEKVANLWYYIYDEGSVEVDFDTGNTDLSDADIGRNGDYSYRITTNLNGNNRGGQLTSAFSKAGVKVDNYHGGA